MMQNSDKLCLLYKFWKQPIVSKNTVASFAEDRKDPGEAKTGNNERRI